MSTCTIPSSRFAAPTVPRRPPSRGAGSGAGRVSVAARQRRTWPLGRPPDLSEPAPAGTTPPDGDPDESRTHQSFQSTDPGTSVRPDQDFDREPRENPVMVLWRDQEARDHQLPHLQARARWIVLRAHLRADQGLRVLVRQVQAHEVQRYHLREVWRRGDAVAGAARAHGPHRAGGAGRAYLVPEVVAKPDRPAARHDAQRPRAHSLFRILRGAGAGPHAAPGSPVVVGG